MKVNLIDYDKIILTASEDINLEKEFTALFKLVAKELKQPYKKLSLNIEYVLPSAILEINNRTRNINEVTDVLSFPYIDCSQFEKICVKDHKFEFDNCTKTLLVGDIIICVERAASQALDFGHSLKRELCYLAVHGMLHCFGFDHENEKDKKIMRAMEELILAKRKIIR